MEQNLQVEKWVFPITQKILYSKEKEQATNIPVNMGEPQQYYAE